MFNERIVCTYLYVITKYGYPPPAEDTVKYIDEMTKLNFKTIELEGIREEHLLKVYELKKDIKQRLDKGNINLPYFCTVLPALTSFDKKVQDEQFALFEKGCETAKLFGAKGVLDNSPLPPYQFPDDIPVTRHYEEDAIAGATFPADLSWDKYWEHLINTFKTVCDIAAKYDLTYNLHPALGVLISNADGYLHFFDKVQKDNLRFNLDTANQFVQKENLQLALIRLKDHIDYIHVSDNRGVKTEHLAIGNGVINWKQFFDTLDRINFKGHIGLDIGGDESGVNNLDEAYTSAARFIENNYLNK